MKRITKGLTILGLVLIVFVVFGLVAIFNAVGWLRGSDQPIPARAIFILAGPPSRSVYAADLYNHGYARDVYMTHPIRDGWFKALDDLNIYFPSVERVQTDVLLKKMVPSEHIHLVGDICKSTIDEAEVANSVFNGKDCTILIVTSPYHVRRAQMIFGAKMRNCRFRILGTPYEPFPWKWWTDQEAARNVLLEVAKITYYKLGGRFQRSKEEDKEEAGRR